MRQKGFTLIELLAVIVVLAIIALIATPMVLNTIEKSRKGSASSSAYSYINEVETQMTTYALYHSGSFYSEGKYTVAAIQNNLSVELKGSMPTEGTICIGKNGLVTEASLKINNYIVHYDGKTATTTDLKDIEEIDCNGSSFVKATYKVGDAITVNLNDTLQDQFYVLADNGDTVKAIYKGALGEPIEWSEDEMVAASCAFKETPVYEALKQRTSTWSNAVSIRLPNECDLNGRCDPEEVNDSDTPTINGVGASVIPDSPLNFLRADGQTTFYTNSAYIQTKEYIQAGSDESVYLPKCGIYIYELVDREDGAIVEMGSSYLGSSIQPIITVSKDHIAG